MISLILSRMDALEDARRRRLARIQTLKTIPFVLLIVGIGLYQLEWIGGLENIQIEYDFSKYSINPIQNQTKEGHLPTDTAPIIAQMPLFNSSMINPTGEGLGDFFAYFLSYLTDENFTDSLNLSAAANNILNSSHTVDQIQAILNQSITDANMIYEAFVNNQINETLIQTFLQEVWEKALLEYFPSSWAEPIEILIKNTGKLRFAPISFIGSFLFRNNSISFLSLQNVYLASDSPINLNFTLISIVNDIIQLIFEDLVNLTQASLFKDPVGTIKRVQGYFHDTLLETTFGAQLIIDAYIGIVHIGANMYLNLTNILRALDMGIYPQLPYVPEIPTYPVLPELENLGSLINQSFPLTHHFRKLKNIL